MVCNDHNAEADFVKNEETVLCDRNVEEKGRDVFVRPKS